MKKALLLSLWLTVGLSTLSRATTITLSEELTGRSAVDSHGAALADGSLILIGTFAQPQNISALSVANLSSLAGWVQFADPLQTSTVFGFSGKLLGTETDLDATAFDGKDIYLWVFNGSTIESSTEYGIFTAPGADPAWVFPDNSSGLDSSLVLDLDGSPLAGVDGVGSADASHLTLVGIPAVPEPAVWSLAALAFAVVVVPRLRRLAA